MGGSNGHSDELSCGETYDARADEWTQVPELRTNRCNAGQSAVLLLFSSIITFNRLKCVSIFKVLTHVIALVHLKASAP